MSSVPPCPQEDTLAGHCSGTVVQGVAMRGPEGPAEEAAACSPRTAQLLSDEENARRLQQEEDDAALAARMQASHDAALRQRLSHEHHARLSAYHADAGAMHRAGYYHSPMPVHHPVPGAVYVAANVGVRPVPPAAAYPRGDWYMEECAYCNWETQVYLHELRFRCANCHRVQATGSGVGKSNWCLIS